MKHLLVAVHGSRRESSNDELRLLGAKVSASVGVAFDGVKVAFLEFASASVGAARVDFFNSGATEVVLLPYFLSAGNHVVIDIPREINKVVDQWPDKHLKVLPHFGALDEMANFIAQACKNDNN